VDVADQGPGPRDPEIPHHTGTTKPGWARNLTTVAVVPPRPRVAGDGAEGRGGSAGPDAETRADEVADRADESDATRAAETAEAPAADTADDTAAQESDGAERPGAGEPRDREDGGPAVSFDGASLVVSDADPSAGPAEAARLGESPDAAVRVAESVEAGDLSLVDASADAGAGEARDGEGAGLATPSDADRSAEPAEAAPTAEAPAATVPAAGSAETGGLFPAAASAADVAEGPRVSEAPAGEPRDGAAAGVSAVPAQITPTAESSARAVDSVAREVAEGAEGSAEPDVGQAVESGAVEATAGADSTETVGAADAGSSTEGGEPGKAAAAVGVSALAKPASAAALSTEPGAPDPVSADASADPDPDPDTALLAPVSAVPAADPDTALLRPVGKGKAKADGEDDELDAWVASLGNRPAELEAKPDESGDGGDGTATEKAEESGEPSGKRRRLVNPWMAAAGVAALLLAGAAVVQNPFTMATAQRVPQSDVPRMSDPEPPKDSAPVDGGSARDLELPPVLPAAAPGSAGSPQPSGVIGTISASPTRTSAPPPAAPVNAGSNGIPQIVLAAYQQAAATTAKADPACKLPWQLLAGIGRVESSHANNGQVTANGTAVTPILGPRLDGSHSTAVIRDTDKGVYDLDPEFDRAVGPMQFIPSTWKSYGMDGNKDGKLDPENVYDASLAAARYLCAGDRDLSRPADLDRAIYSYNKSTEYVSTVKAWMQFYGNGVRAVPATTTPPATKATTKTSAATTKPSGQ
jgi:hypothetical protein